MVFSGLATCRGLLDVPTPRVRMADSAPLSLDLHATSSLDRLGGELASHTVLRKPQRDGSELWVVDAHTRLSVWEPPEVLGEGQEDAVREFAVLLTRVESITDALTIRVTALPVQVALWCIMHAKSNRSPIDSPPIEDAIAVIVGRRDFLAELRALPGELRQVVADGVGAFAATQACRWVLGRIVIEARTTPQLIDTVLRRLDAVAQIPRS
jgi:hypothetical protein